MLSVRRVSGRITRLSARKSVQKYKDMGMKEDKFNRFLLLEKAKDVYEGAGPSTQEAE